MADRAEAPVSDSRFDDLPDWRNEYFKDVKPYRDRMHALACQVDGHRDLKRTWRAINHYYQDPDNRFMDVPFCNASSHYCGYMQDEFTPLMDTDAVDAISVCSAGLSNAFTSPNKQWFSFHAKEKNLDELRTVREFMERSTDVVRGALEGSNAYSALTKMYKICARYGFGTSLIDSDELTTINVLPLGPGEVLLDSCYRKGVDTCYVRTRMTARQLAQKFGRKNKGFTPAVRECLKSASRLSEEFTVFRCIQPINAWQDAPSAWVEEGWRYETVYFLDVPCDCRYDDSGHHHILRYERHRSKPFVVVHWEDVADHPYGYGAGAEVLAEQMSLQLCDEKEMNSLNLKMEPMFGVTPDVDQEMSKHPAFRSMKRIVDASGANIPGPKTVNGVYPVLPNFDAGLVEYESTVRKRIVDRIRKAFFYNEWKTFETVERSITAYEASMRRAEQLGLLMALVNRIKVELFDSMLERVYYICDSTDHNLIPEPPEELGGTQVTIDYESDFTESIRRLKHERTIAAAQGAIQYAAGVASFDMEAAVESVSQFDHVEIVRSMAINSGAPAAILRDPNMAGERVSGLMRAQAAAAEQQAVTQAAEQAKTLGSAKVTPDTALGAALEGMTSGQ